MPATQLTQQEKVARVRETYDRLNRSDFAGSADMFAEDGIWHGFLIGEVKGRPAIKAAYERLKSLNASWELHDVLASGDHVVALHELTVKKGDKTAHSRQVMVAHLNADGQISELWTITNPQELAPVLSS